MPPSPSASSRAARAARAAALVVVPSVAAGLRSRRGQAIVRALSARSGRVERLPAELLGVAPPRHPLAPAALRVERTRIHGADPADQVAVTVWFGEGPSLPPIIGARHSAGRTALRVGASVLGAAAVAALTTAAARLAEAERPRIVEGR